MLLSFPFLNTHWEAVWRTSCRKRTLKHSYWTPGNAEQNSIPGHCEIHFSQKSTSALENQALNASRRNVFSSPQATTHVCSSQQVAAKRYFMLQSHRKAPQCRIHNTSCPGSRERCTEHYLETVITYVFSQNLTSALEPSTCSNQTNHSLTPAGNNTSFRELLGTCKEVASC